MEETGFTQTVPQLELSGSHYEIGVQHGEQLRPHILRQLAIYRGMFMERCKLEWPQILEVAAKYHDTIARLTPHLLEEMRGIADGVGGDVRLMDIVALNARSELALGMWDDGCTTLAWEVPAQPRGTHPARVLLAQNWDWRLSVAENLAIVAIAAPGKPKIWMVIEAGIVGKIGMNAASVGVALNAIRAKPFSTSLLPFHVLLRLALECTSVEHVIATIERIGGVGSAQHILVADPLGARALEISPNGHVYLRADAHGLLVHTNHFLENKLVHEPPWLPGSPVRLRRATELCMAIRAADPGLGGLDGAVLRARVFSDEYHEGGGVQHAICCSSEPTDEFGNRGTLFNIVMELKEGKEPRAEVLIGRPGSHNRNPVILMPW